MIRKRLNYVCVFFCRSCLDDFHKLEFGEFPHCYANLNMYKKTLDLPTCPDAFHLKSSPDILELETWPQLNISQDVCRTE